MVLDGAHYLAVAVVAARVRHCPAVLLRARAAACRIPLVEHVRFCQHVTRSIVCPADFLSAVG